MEVELSRREIDIIVRCLRSAESRNKDIVMMMEEEEVEGGRNEDMLEAVNIHRTYAEALQEIREYLEDYL